MVNYSFTAEELNLKEDDDRVGGFWVDKDGKANGEPNVRFVKDGFKCGGCNWECSSLYAQADTREEAKAQIEAGEIGMCGECFSEYLVEAK